MVILNCQTKKSDAMSGFLRIFAVAYKSNVSILQEKHCDIVL